MSVTVRMYEPDDPDHPALQLCPVCGKRLDVVCECSTIICRKCGEVAVVPKNADYLHKCKGGA